MINLLKDKSSKVVGISINGKKFQLGRELCQLLEQEEKVMFEKIENKKKQIKDLERQLKDAVFKAEADKTYAELSFTSDGQINLKSIHFINKYKALGEVEKELLREVLEDFLLVINKTIESRNELSNTAVKKLAA